MDLRIGGLSDDITEDELMELFAGVGRVESIKVIRDISSGKSRGFAIAKMPINTEAEEAIKRLHGLALGDRQIVVTRIHETLPGEMEFREWLTDNAGEVLRSIGVRPGQTVLDFGCGSGVFSMASASIVGNRGRVYAVDVRPVALERLKKEADREGLANIETMLLDRLHGSIPLRADSMNVILLYDVLQEINDQPLLLKELHRVLRQDGFLSVFPMHLGTDRLLNIMKSLSIFFFRDRYNVPGFQSASEVINFEKCPA